MKLNINPLHIRTSKMFILRIFLKKVDLCHHLSGHSKRRSWLIMYNPKRIEKENNSFISRVEGILKVI